MGSDRPDHEHRARGLEIFINRLQSKLLSPKDLKPEHKDWLERPEAEGASFLLICQDRFDYGYYPVFIAQSDMFEEVSKHHKSEGKLGCCADIVTGVVQLKPQKKPEQSEIIDLRPYSEAFKPEGAIVFSAELEALKRDYQLVFDKGVHFRNERSGTVDLTAQLVREALYRFLTGVPKLFAEIERLETRKLAAEEHITCLTQGNDELRAQLKGEPDAPDSS